LCRSSTSPAPSSSFRGHKVLLDAELAALYGVSTKRLNEQVKCNAERLPEDFLFRLSAVEVEALNRPQFATGSAPQVQFAPALKLTRQMEHIQRLPKAKQRLVMGMTDNVLAQQDR
jgi:ORF6N domain